MASKSDPSSPTRRAKSFRAKLVRLHEKRRKTKHAHAAGRGRLTPKQRIRVLKKTGRRCHICGGRVGQKWHADHIASHTHGGEHAEENFLPAHGACNVDRWHYLPEEFRIIIRLGIWARSEVEKGGSLGVEIAERFTAYERAREQRRGKR